MTNNNRGIPANISYNDILKAIERIDNETIINEKRKARVWALEFNNNLYPCKLVISYANKFPNKEELNPDPNIFTTYMAQKYLTRKGFKIVKIKKSLF